MLQAFRNKISGQGIIQITVIVFAIVSLAAIFFLIRKQKYLMQRVDNIESFINNSNSKLGQNMSGQNKQSHVVQTSKTKKKPENIVCEGGVCRIQKSKPPSKNQQQKSVNKTQSQPPQFNPLSILMQTIPLGIPQNIPTQSRLSPIEEDDDEIEYVKSTDKLQEESEDDIGLDGEESDDLDSDDDLDIALEEELKDLDE